jgi:uncharacterized membrane protein YGL010W
MGTVTIDIFGNIGQTIQLAIAPVFLLTGIAAFLGVLSNRLSRITDRARVLERRISKTTSGQNEFLQNEIASLWRRIGMINKSICLCTISALLICLVIMTLFLRELIHTGSLVIVVLFISAMLTLIMALIYFLREVTRATRSMKMGIEIAVDEILKD